MNRKSVMAVVACLVLALLATANTTGSKSPSQMLIQTDWLAAHLNDSNVVVIHVAPNKSSYDAGHALVFYR